MSFPEYKIALRQAGNISTEGKHAAHPTRPVAE